MKKIIMLSLACLLVVTLVGCSGYSTSSTEEEINNFTIYVYDRTGQEIIRVYKNCIEYEMSSNVTIIRTKTNKFVVNNQNVVIIVEGVPNE